MKHMKLFENFDLELKAELERHRKALSDINRKIIDVVNTCMFIFTDDYGFQQFYQPDYTGIGYSREDDDSAILLTQEFVNELLSANKKLKREVNRQLYITAHGNTSMNYELEQVLVSDDLREYIGKRLYIEFNIY